MGGTKTLCNVYMVNTEITLARKLGSYFKRRLNLCVSPRPVETCEDLRPSFFTAFSVFLMQGKWST